ncbi:MAG: M81 family metallopeptidase [Pseudomonadota bacterium]
MKNDPSSETKKRVFLAGFAYESHSFSRCKAVLDEFFLLEGENLDEHGENASTEIGGAYSCAKTHGWNLATGPCYMGVAGGPLTSDTYEMIADAIINALKAAMPVDGVFIVLHGSACSESCPDLEGDLTRRIRTVVGDTPIAATLDLHANVSDELVGNVDILTSYRTTPHVDLVETAVRAGDLLEKTMRGLISPKVHVMRGPMMDALDRGRTLDPSGPMRQALEKAETHEKAHADILSVDVNVGFAWGDRKEIGPSIVVMSDGDTKATRAALATIGRDLLDDAWEGKSAVTIKTIDLSEVAALLASAAPNDEPLIIADMSDNPGAGAHGDSTNLLKILIDSQVTSGVFYAIADPDMVKTAQAAGVGQIVKGPLGGKRAPEFGGGPLDIEARVVSIIDGRYVRKGPYMPGFEADLGPSVRLKISAIDVIVTTYPSQSEEREQLRIFGYDPNDASVIFLKGQNHLRADYDQFSSKLLYVDGGGIGSRDYAIFPYKNIRRPIWPLDDVDFTLSGSIGASSD